jgi:diguanylate cyclase (GGDEF)-like protein/PAS domain S-box-containing protein
VAPPLERADDRAKFATMVHHSPDVMIIFGDDLEMKYLSAAAGQFGWTLAELGSVFDVIHPDDRAQVTHELGRVFDGTSEPGRMVTFRVSTRSGEYRYLESRAIDLRDDPNVAGVVVNTRDVTERVLQSDRLAHAARHDYLTELPNRAFLLEQLVAALARSGRSGQPVLLCYLDLNDFKGVNDRFGHATGDQVLIGMAERIRGHVRAGDMASRFGGDEFVIFCETVNNEQEATDFMTRLQQTLDADYETTSGRVVCKVAIGHSFSHPDDTAETLLGRADADLYTKKARPSR